VKYKNDGLEIIGGGSYSNYTNDHFGEVIWGSNLATDTEIRDRYYFSDAQKTDISTFAKASFNVTDKLSAFVDVQGRFVSYQTEGLTSDRDAIDVDADFNFFNPKLGLRLKNDIVKLNANVYYMNYKNQLVLTGAINDVGEAVRATSGKSYRLGLEIDADIRLSKYFALRSNLAISRNRNVDFTTEAFGGVVNLGETPISNSPDIVAGNALVYQPINNLQISLLTKYVGDQYLGNFGGEVSDLEKLDDYATADFNLVYELKMNKVFKSIVFSGLVNNIFNEKYVDRGYYGTFNYDGGNGEIIVGDYAGFYPQATTNFLLGATFKF